MVKKINIIFLLFVFSTSLYAQNEKRLWLEGQIFSSHSENVHLVQNDGKTGNIIASFPLDEKGFFKGVVNLKDKDYYILGLEDNQSINLVYQGEDTLKVYGDGRNLFYHSNVIGSEASTQLSEFARFNAQYKRQLDSANSYLQANPHNQQQIQQQFSAVHEDFVAQRRDFLNRNANSPALIAVLSNLNLESEWDVYEYVVTRLQRSFAESPTVKRIVAEYNGNKAKMFAQNPMASGNMAKEISLPNPEGDTLNLSDYKGKYVLIDFWASWCGPCRRENPNVVRLYEKYKDKGFEVFSVSLDRSKDAWVKAIEQDGLAWEGHVSDLKYWQSEPAKAYGVSSIPATVLLDKEGKIIQSNLRGEALENILKSLLE